MFDWRMFFLYMICSLRAKTRPPVGDARYLRLLTFHACQHCIEDRSLCRVMLVGWGGNNGSTVTAGILANKQWVPELFWLFDPLIALFHWAPRTVKCRHCSTYDQHYEEFQGCGRLGQHEMYVLIRRQMLLFLPSLASPNERCVLSLLAQACLSAASLCLVW